MTTPQESKLKELLFETKSIVKTHIENVRERGEDFNIFSILKMETDETKTHSGMIVALLDPKGNHYQNDTFLKLFLNVIGYDPDENLEFTKVKAEHNLGPIPKDYSEGGFIDILISFPSGKAIAIENKINAGDQPKQMYRYSLYKSGACTLYYLTMVAKHPEQFSLHTLTDKDYDVLLYDNHILKWLEQCIQVVKPGSIIENALKQYLILIKKITNTMDKHLEDNLKSLILNNLEEAKYISSHYQKAVESIKERFRSAVWEELNKINIKAHLGKDTSNNYSSIWIDSAVLNGKGASIGIESFSGKGHHNGRLFVGILDRNAIYDKLAEGDVRLSNYWPVIREIKTLENNNLHLSSSNILERLNTDSGYFEDMVKEVVRQVMEFVEVYGDANI
jgi:hypothetical protein